MLSFTDPFFWLFFLYFLLTIFFAFYIPGVLLLRRLEISSFQRSILAIIIGMVLWGWQGVIFGYLNVRGLTYAYLFILFLLWLYFLFRQRQSFSIKKQKIKKLDWLIITLIAIGVLVQVTTIFFTGFLTSQGLSFCCGNSSDLLFHGALTNQLIHQFPPTQPGMYGVIVQNYHYWSNIVVAELIRVFHLPILPTQFQYTNIFISLFLGLSVIVFGQIVTVKKAFIAWLLFFLYFGGDMGYLVLVAFGKGFSFSLSSLEDGAKFLINPPRAFSIVIFFAALSLLTLWIKKKEKLTGFLTGLLIGSSIGFKVYTGIFGMVGLGALTLYYLIKKDFRILQPLFAAILVGALVYLPVNRDAGGMYFTGLWIFENFIVSPHLGLQRLEHARLVYLAHNSWLRVIQYEALYISLFIIATFGSKLLGLIQTKKSLQLLPRELHIFLIFSLFVSLIAGLFFQQTSGGANTFNFLVSIFIFGSIYTALACHYWSEKLKGIWKYLFIVIIVAITVPRVIHFTYMTVQELVQNKSFVISHEELQAYAYLNEKNLPHAMYLIDERHFDMHAGSPYPSIFLNGQIYLSGRGILESHGIDVSKKKKVSDIIFKNPYEKNVKKALIQNDIDYIIMRPHDHFAATRSGLFLHQIYKNKDIKIFEFDK